MKPIKIFIASLLIVSASMAFGQELNPSAPEAPYAWVSIPTSGCGCYASGTISTGFEWYNYSGQLLTCPGVGPGTYSTVPIVIKYVSAQVFPGYSACYFNATVSPYFPAGSHSGTVSGRTSPYTTLVLKPNKCCNSCACPEDMFKE